MNICSQFLNCIYILKKKLTNKIIKFFDENFTNTKGASYYLDPEVSWKKNVEEYDVAIYTDKMSHTLIPNKNKINFAWILEPTAINEENYIKIVGLNKNFQNVFGFSKKLEKLIDNFVFIPYGGTWIKEEDFYVYPKSKKISCFLSWKRFTSGHLLRHEIYENYKDSNYIDFFGSGCNNTVEYKLDGLRNYMFSVSIENSIESDYFTEKLIDCFLTGTIPIYYGTNNLLNYFDENGIIYVESLEDLNKLLSTLTEELYLSKIDSIKRNFNLAKNYIYPERLIQKHIEKNV